MRNSSSAVSKEFLECFDNVKDSVNAALAHYQIWFTLRGKGRAIDTYSSVTNDYPYVDFFHISNSGNYNLMFVEVACTFDTDSRADRFGRLKELLREEDYSSLADRLASSMESYKKLISDMLAIRSKLIAHKESAASPAGLYDRHGIIPDRIGQMLELLVDLMTQLERTFKENASWGTTEKTQRWEKATYELLEALQKGRNS